MSPKLLTKRRFRDGRYPQPRASLFRADLHRLCLRQDEGPAGIRPRLNELLPVVCFSAGVAVSHHVGETVRRTEQPAIPDRNDDRHGQRFRAGDSGRLVFSVKRGAGSRDTKSRKQPHAK